MSLTAADRRALLGLQLRFLAEFVAQRRSRTTLTTTLDKMSSEGLGVAFVEPTGRKRLAVRWFEASPPAVARDKLGLNHTPHCFRGPL